ncbi:MAG TPA: DUF167 domain-containing protein [Candidatus Poseidoniaceae archaeon]|jgi:hypothetical protein|nr:DUF167 domain-containing protein [Candidatus Poseidoniaceae archaeon]
MERKSIIQIDFSGNVIFEIEAQPNSSKSNITGYNQWRNRLQISTKAQAIKGAANKEIIKIISESFNLQKNQVQIISGQTSRLKQIKLLDIEIEAINKVISNILEGFK